MLECLRSQGVWDLSQRKRSAIADAKYIITLAKERGRAIKKNDAKATKVDADGSSYGCSEDGITGVMTLASGNTKRP